MKKVLTLLLVVILVLSLFAGCQKESPIELTDRAGNSITVNGDFDKIVSFAPSITEILVDLGFADKIIAVTTVDNTAGLKDGIPKFDFMKPDIEALMALESDLLLASSMTMAGGADDPFVSIGKMGTTVAYIPTAETISGIYLDIEFLGKLLKSEGKTKVLIDTMKQEIDNISKLSQSISSKKKVYLEIAPSPYMYSTGSGTYLNEMIEIAGGVNILNDVKGWTAVSDEQILSRNPDVIFSNVNYMPNPIEEIKARSGWNDVNAILNNEVYAVDNNATSLANHNIVKGIKEIATLLYPDVFNFTK